MSKTIFSHDSLDGDISTTRRDANSMKNAVSRIIDRVVNPYSRRSINLRAHPWRKQFTAKSITVDSSIS